MIHVFCCEFVHFVLSHYILSCASISICLCLPARVCRCTLDSWQAEQDRFRLWLPLSTMKGSFEECGCHSSAETVKTSLVKVWVSWSRPRCRSPFHVVAKSSPSNEDPRHTYAQCVLCVWVNVYCAQGVTMVLEHRHVLQWLHIVGHHRSITWRSNANPYRNSKNRLLTVDLKVRWHLRGLWCLPATSLLHWHLS